MLTEQTNEQTNKRTKQPVQNQNAFNILAGFKNKKSKYLLGQFVP